LDKATQEIIERVAEKYKGLPEPKQMYVLGVMDGIQISKENQEKKSA
jgi:hypothetical protein